MKTFLQSMRIFILGALISVCSLIWTAPAMAASNPRASDGSLNELQSALEQTKDPQRLAELQELQQAVASSDDRAQVTNDSSHQVGIFARYKKDPADSVAQFFILGPGHQSDDDYDIIAVYVPPQVGLSWPEDNSIQPAQTARVLTVVDGEQLTITDPKDSAVDDQSVSYGLNLPPFRVANASPSVAVIPQLNQPELDQSPETAPLD